MSVTNTQLYLTFFLLTCSSSSSAVPLPGAVLKFCTALFFPRMTISIKAWVKTPKIHSCTQEPAWVMLPACHGTKPGTFDGGSSTRGMAAITNTGIWFIPPDSLPLPRVAVRRWATAGSNHSKHAKENERWKQFLRLSFSLSGKIWVRLVLTSICNWYEHHWISEPKCLHHAWLTL